MAVVSLLVLAIAAGVTVPALVASHRHLSSTHGQGSSPPVTSTVAPVPYGLEHIGTFAQSGSLFTAGGGAFFSVTSPQSCGGSATLTTITDAGTQTDGTIADPLACYFSTMAADASSVYLGTSVIEKFSSASNEVVRLDPVTLGVLGRRDVPGDVVGLVAGPNGLLVATPVEVLLLDPATLATRASYAVPGASPPPVGSAAISSLALGQGEVWVTYGSAQSSTLYRLDPSNLTLLGSTPAGSGQGLRVVADAESTWILGEDAAWPVEASGVLGTSVSVPALQAAAALGQDLVVLEGAAIPESLVLLAPDGTTLAAATAGDAGGELALDGNDVWVLATIQVVSQGSVVQEEGIAHFLVEGSSD